MANLELLLYMEELHNRSTSDILAQPSSPLRFADEDLGNPIRRIESDYESWVMDYGILSGDASFKFTDHLIVGDLMMFPGSRLSMRSRRRDQVGEISYLALRTAFYLNHKGISSYAALKYESHLKSYIPLFGLNPNRYLVTLYFWDSIGNTTTVKHLRVILHDIAKNCDPKEYEKMYGTEEKFNPRAYAKC